MMDELAQHHQRFNYSKYVVPHKAEKFISSGHSDWNERTFPPSNSEVITWLGQAILDHLFLKDNLYFIFLCISTLFIQQGLIKICNSFLTIFTHFFIEVWWHGTTMCGHQDFTWFCIRNWNHWYIHFILGCLHALSRLSFLLKMF